MPIEDRDNTLPVYLHRDGDSVIIRVRAESEDGDIIGDLTVEVRPGQDAMGKTYDEWAALPDGSIEIEIPAV